MKFSIKSTVLPPVNLHVREIIQNICNGLTNNNNNYYNRRETDKNAIQILFKLQLYKVFTVVYKQRNDLNSNSLREMLILFIDKMTPKNLHILMMLFKSFFKMSHHIQKSTSDPYICKSKTPQTTTDS